MDIDLTSIATSTLSVIVVGILLGAGLPLLFSLGIVLQEPLGAGFMSGWKLVMPAQS